jgi:pimeloyl-ACP methyl ester carboxylesterase
METRCTDADTKRSARTARKIGLMTAGHGPALLLVHGGMGRLERWAPLWDLLIQRWQVTAMDPCGRGSSGDTEPYLLTKEYDDIAAVLAALASRAGRPADAFGHSYGATCLLGAAARGAEVRRLVAYEPPGPETRRHATGPWARHPLIYGPAQPGCSPRGSPSCLAVMATSRRREWPDAQSPGKPCRWLAAAQVPSVNLNIFLLRSRSVSCRKKGALRHAPACRPSPARLHGPGRSNTRSPRSDRSSTIEGQRGAVRFTS